MGNMLFVDLANGTWHEEELSEEMARMFVGDYATVSAPGSSWNG